MATINEVADALIATINAKTGINATTIRLKPQLPSVMVYPDLPAQDGESASYYETFGGGMIQLRMCVCVLASAANVDGQQRWLNDVISPFGPLSIPRAILENRTLGTDPDEATGGAAATMTASIGKIRDYGIVTFVDGSTTALQAKLPLILVDSTGESHLGVKLGSEANLASPLAVTNGADFHALSH